MIPELIDTLTIAIGALVPALIIGYMLGAAYTYLNMKTQEQELLSEIHTLEKQLEQQQETKP